MSTLPALCKENPPVTSGPPNKGPLMLEVYYFEIMQKVIPDEQDIFLMAYFIITVTS